VVDDLMGVNSGDAAPKEVTVISISAEVSIHFGRNLIKVTPQKVAMYLKEQSQISKTYVLRKQYPVHMSR